MFVIKITSSGSTLQVNSCGYHRTSSHTNTQTAPIVTDFISHIKLIFIFIRVMELFTRIYHKASSAVRNDLITGSVTMATRGAFTCFTGEPQLSLRHEANPGKNMMFH